MIANILFAIVLVLPTAGFNPSTWYVPDDYPTIQDAIDAVAPGDTIIVRPGTYVETIDFKGKDLMVKSSQGPGLTVIDGNASGSVVTFKSGEGQNAVLEGFTVTNGSGTQISGAVKGMGIFCGGTSSPTIRRNIIRENSNDYYIGPDVHGAGLFCGDQAAPCIEDNAIMLNKIYNHFDVKIFGGGICCGDSSAPTIQNNVIKHNGLYLVKSGSGFGGGIYCGGASTPHIENNLIYKNEILSDEGFHGAGGGICCDIPSMSVVNNTVFGNIAESGGGFHCSSGAAPVIQNTIIRDNEAAFGAEIHGGNPAVSYSDVKGGWPGAGNIDADPLFVHPSIDFRLLQDPCQPGINNPCVDAGDPGTAVVTGSTKTDAAQDTGIVDMGYHYSLDSIHRVPVQHPTIQTAIDAAYGGHKVLVAPGTYIENIDFRGKAVAVRSDADGDPNTFDPSPETTVIDGNDSGSVVKFISREQEDSVIEGFTITNGSGTLGPWGYTLYGGGIYCYDHSHPTIIGNDITANFADDDFSRGGGIGCYWNCRPFILKNRIHWNLSTARGGGICCYQMCNAKIYNNFIYENVSMELGGGLYLYGSDPFPWNRDAYYSQEVFNNTITDNWALDEGGGIYIFTAGPIIRNCILWNNVAPEGKEIYRFPMAAPEITYCDVEGGISGWFANHIIDQDPLFVDAQKDDYHLSWRSPCINRGTNEEALLEDFDEDQRPVMGTVDMGADEFMGTHPLEADVRTLSESTGGTVTFALKGEAANAGKFYIMVGSFSGTIPGNGLPGGQAILPLQWDLLTDFIIANLNTPLFTGFMGNLDQAGSGIALFDTLGPMPQGLAGISLYFAYTLKPFDFVSNPMAIQIVP